ncbi:hypothetical protein P5673_018000 [Acropora cervicornis]|uniref:Uncharacterized protein n=1 Tax=Acropora cervicornis TaxID=6130 RepID=A0AAD9QDT5_ACRCE|nr:hypothetical protein P5673_018000 [Acropora cervicornis]
MIGFAIYVKLLTSFALLWNSALSYRRPLGDYINQYETLNYDTASLRQQHNRVRRSSPNSDQRIELKLKTEKSEGDM